METMKFDLNKKYGAFKPLNATNGGPWHKRHTQDQFRSNFEDYKAARFPYSRNHDSNLGSGIYGAPFVHDISAIFPDFDADVNAPESYDFPCTDESILATLEAGTETFFRLGQSIEHQIKKHDTLPPKDFKKWAQVCEHIIRHYNEGWADGYHLNIEYWEIWNEPDLDADDAEDKRTWGGTKWQFFDLYEITATHLKKCFPDLKIGGPGYAGEENLDWMDEFLAEMRKRNVEIDFFSWHSYVSEPCVLIEKANKVKSILLKYGYENAESILDEWNYLKGWTDEFMYTIKAVHGMKSAAYVMAVMSEAQKCEGIDMLMYYDTRPSAFCGVFDFYTYEPLKGYYPLKWYGDFYDLKSEVRCENEPENIYTIAGVDDNGKVTCIITHYSDNDDAESKEIEIDFGRDGKYEVYFLDENHDAEIILKENLNFTMSVNSCIMIKEK